MINDDLIPFEQWRDIPDMKFHYQVSDLGRIAHVYPDGHRRILVPVKVKYGYMLKLTDSSGKRVTKHKITWVGDVWIGRKEGYCYCTKNGFKTDWRVSNITHMKKADINARINRGKRKAVFKINTKGEIVEIYKSVKECADANGFVKSAISTRCRGEFKTLLAIDGYAYCYEDNKRYLHKIMRYTNGK